MYSDQEPNRLPCNAGGFGGERAFGPPSNRNQHHDQYGGGYARRNNYDGHWPNEDNGAAVDWNSHGRDERHSRSNAGQFSFGHSGRSERDERLQRFDSQRDDRRQDGGYRRDDYGADREGRGGSFNRRDDGQGYRGGNNRRDEGGYGRRDDGRGDRGFTRSDDRRDAYDRNENRGGQARGYTYNDDRRSGFDKNDERRAGGYSRNDNDDRRDRGFGGGYRDNYSRSGFNNQREGDAKERAPQDWVPETQSSEQVQEELRRGAEEIDITKDRKVQIHNSDVKTQIDSWETSGLHQLILRNIERCGYKHVRPIQAAIIPQIMRGYDVMGKAETGGGKTAAFALPIIHKIMTSCDLDESSFDISPIAIILAPSRELVKQIYENIEAYAKGTGVKVGFTYGQIPTRENLAKLRQGCHILVGACGRVMSYIESNYVVFDKMKFLVLDEADKMLDNPSNRNSGDHLQAILRNPRYIKADKQVLLFSATFSDQVVSWMKRTSKKRPNHTGQVVRAEVESGRMNPRINLEFVEVANAADRQQKLFEYVEKGKKQDGSVSTTLIFVQEKMRSDFIALSLSKKGFKAKSLNGDRSQDQREEALKLFKNGSIDILVGTDVCSRGLDVKNLDRVINFELPVAQGNALESAQDTFIHRSGRTGRFKEGLCVSFIDPLEQKDVTMCPFFVQCFADIGKPDKCPEFLRKLASSNGFRPQATLSKPGMSNVQSDSEDDSKTPSFTPMTFGQGRKDSDDDDSGDKKFESAQEEQEENW